jgi:hypothetical protein
MCPGRTCCVVEEKGVSQSTLMYKLFFDPKGRKQRSWQLRDSTLFVTRWGNEDDDEKAL